MERIVSVEELITYASKCPEYFRGSYLLRKVNKSSVTYDVVNKEFFGNVLERGLRNKLGLQVSGDAASVVQNFLRYDVVKNVVIEQEGERASYWGYANYNLLDEYFVKLQMDLTMLNRETNQVVRSVKFLPFIEDSLVEGKLKGNLGLCFALFKYAYKSILGYDFEFYIVGYEDEYPYRSRVFKMSNELYESLVVDVEALLSSVRADLVDVNRRWGSGYEDILVEVS